MNRTLLAWRRPLAYCLATVIGLSLSGCAATPENSPTSTAEVVTTQLDSGLPADAMPEPERGQSCPYLDSDWLANTNGQRVTDQGIDSRFDTPACVFWSYSEAPQATVIIRHTSTKAEAYAVVDWAAPIDSTDPVEDNGWSGGRSGNDTGAVYAVSKDTVAVVVFSDQQQSVKAELIAQEVIKNLGL